VTEKRGSFAASFLKSRTVPAHVPTNLDSLRVLIHPIQSSRKKGTEMPSYQNHEIFCLRTLRDMDRYFHAAGDAAQGCIRSLEEFNEARSKVNQRQFQERLELAEESGDEAAIEKILEQQRERSDALMLAAYAAHRRMVGLESNLKKLEREVAGARQLIDSGEISDEVAVIIAKADVGIATASIFFARRWMEEAGARVKVYLANAMEAADRLYHADPSESRRAQDGFAGLVFE